jgi:hypothetical protein
VTYIIVFIKPINQKVQLIFDDNLFIDEKRKLIYPNDIADKYPKLYEIFTPIALKHKTLAFRNDLSDEQIIEFCINNPSCILYVRNIHIIENLSRNKFWFVRSEVAGNPACPENILEKLSGDEDFYVRSKVAGNTLCPISILEKLSRDEKWNVRRAIAKNTNCPSNILEKLSRDEDVWVRSEVAENINSPIYILEKLRQDKDIWVRSLVAKIHLVQSRFLKN